MDDARAELRLASPEGQVDAAKQKTAEAKKASTEAQAALQKAKDDLAAAEEGSKTNKLLLFKVGLAKYSLSGAESTAKTAEQAYLQAQSDEKAIAQAFAGPLAEAEISFGKAGAQFDVALPHKFAQFTDLPEGMQKSLLDLPGLGDGADAIKAPLRELKDTLIEQGQPPNEAVIALGLKTEEAKAMIRESAAKLDGIINQMAQGLQDEMSTMILMLDATLKPGMQAAARAIRDAVQEKGLELTEESIDTVLAEQPRPQQIADADEIADAQAAVKDAEKAFNRAEADLKKATDDDRSDLQEARDQAASALKEAIAKAETFENAISSDSLPYVFSRITLAKDAEGNTVLPYAFNWKGKNVTGTLVFYYDKARDKVTSLVFAKEYKK